MRATKGKRNVCIFSNLFLLVACLSFCPSFSWASALSTPSDFFLEGPLDDQAVTSSKPHYGVATFSVGFEHRFEGHEAPEGQGFSSLFVLETARGHLVARMYDPADGRFISRDPLSYIDGMSLYAGYFVPAGVDPSGKLCCTPWEFIVCTTAITAFLTSSTVAIVSCGLALQPIDPAEPIEIGVCLLAIPSAILSANSVASNCRKCSPSAVAAAQSAKQRIEDLERRVKELEDLLLGD